MVNVSICRAPIGERVGTAGPHRGAPAHTGGEPAQHLVPLSSFAVISYTANWDYVAFAALLLEPSPP